MILVSAFRLTKARIRVYRRERASRAKIAALLVERRELWIEPGAGNKPGAGKWLTIDRTPLCDVWWDLRKGLPFPDGSVRRIYSSHFLEHLTFREGERFLAECMRVLGPGGHFSIAVPNARIYLEAYVLNRPLPEHFFGFTPAYDKTTAIDAVNYMAYMDGTHRYCFDEENLVFRLKSAGLRDVRLRGFDPTLDVKERDFETIYAEGIK
jgi:predicted SAM-dependent methyltransferase